MAKWWQNVINAIDDIVGDGDQPVPEPKDNNDDMKQATSSIMMMIGGVIALVVVLSFVKK